MTDWLPNLFIAGVPKAGTSSLHVWIAAHPQAFGSVEKEARFFVDPGSHIYRPDFNIANGLEGYRAQFPIPVGSAPRVILESTPAYIYQKAALDHIPGLPSRPRCIFVLREPAEQIHSLYNYFRNNWTWIPAGMDFAAFLAAVRRRSHGFRGNELAQNALENARYVTHLNAWRDRLGPERMLVVTFDELRADPRGLTKRIAAWIGLDPAFYDDYDFPRENETYTPRSRLLQRLNVALREHLPKGRAYNRLRAAYRRLNTAAGGGGDDVSAQLAALRAEFAEANAALAREYGLDLSGWSGGGQRASMDS